ITLGLVLVTHQLIRLLLTQPTLQPTIINLKTIGQKNLITENQIRTKTRLL
ncbi:MAG: hypothetical protein QG594_119, partial [Bacteroidota bacterium]|nr:hypothetical protein [Bacteroidota bacterium]